MKKICIITTISGTLEDFVIPALCLFEEHGYDITLVSTMSDQFVKKYSHVYNCINIKMKRGISLIDCLKMPFIYRKLFKQGHFDIVQYATPNASLYASIGAKMAHVRKRVYCQWGIRYVGNSGLMRWQLKQMEHLTCSLSTHIRPASWKNLDFAVEEGLYKREKAAAIGDGGTVGVDLMKYDLSKKSAYRKEIRAKYLPLQHKYVYCFVGRFNIDKGCKELLAAFKRLLSHHNDVALLLVGDFEIELPESLRWIFSSTNVVFTGKDVPDVYKYMAAADVLVHPSYREGFSMVIQEAMAMALPVVTTDIPGPSEVIEKDITGLLAKAKDVDSLFDCMKWMYDYKEEGVVMGLAGRKRCEEKFNRERMIQLTLEDREKILNS